MVPTNLESLTAEYYRDLVEKEIAELESMEVFCPSITDDNEASPIAGCNLAAIKYVYLKRLTSIAYLIVSPIFWSFAVRLTR
jgi:hypothetical protein